MKHFDLDTHVPAPFAGLERPRETPVLGLDLLDARLDRAIDALLAPGRRRAYFMNAHCFNLRAGDRAYADALRRAEFLLPDGIGVELAARMTGGRFAANLNGTDLTPCLLARAAAQGLSVFLLGGRPGVAAAAAETLSRRIDGLRIAGARDGYAEAGDEEATLDAINASGADILLVAMGVPMQELWIDRNFSRIGARLTLGVGALFDFLAGVVHRAPAPIRKARLEWAWRLAQEPRRLARRYLIGNFAFMARAARHTLRQQDGTAAARRALDIGVAGAALIALSPALLATAVAVRLDSRGPALFRQTRVGKNGRPFGMLKFRSMYVDAEARRAALLSSSDRAGLCFKSRTDPRVTRVGRFIRRFSIDEAPQLVNVLKGEMSIVGPRPALPSEVAGYDARALGRLAVKPGVSGIWQVSGRADIAFEKMIDMDLAYVASRTILLDLVILAMTFRAVVSGRGAY
mgnify:CR=1 FL=1